MPRRAALRKARAKSAKAAQQLRDSPFAHLLRPLRGRSQTVRRGTAPHLATVWHG